MGRFSSVNTYIFSSDFGINTFLGHLRGTSGWNLSESSDRRHGKIEPEVAGHRFEMEWTLEKTGNPIYKFVIDGTQLNNRCPQADTVWEKIESLHSRSK